MKKTAEAKQNKRAGWIVGIAASLAVFALFVGIMLFAVSRNVGAIVTDEDVRRGQEHQFTYVGNNKVKKGDRVTWYVDNQRVATYPYDGKNIQLSYTPTEVGATNITVVAGKYNRTTTVNVKKPILTLTAQDMTVTYGDEIPQPRYECRGLLRDDSLDSLNCNVHFQTTNCRCGVSEICFDEVSSDVYEIIYETGHLTILPKEIRIVNTFQKTYDQTTAIECPTLQLEGVLEGDEVFASAAKLYFESKNAGEQNIMTANIELKGKDSDNYVLCEELKGRITPKSLALTGLKVANKNFDGTTKATIERPGKLHGVLDGDSVAIGGLDLCFDGAEIGQHNIVVNNVSLVGLDKDNYVINTVNHCKAKINANR